MNMIAGNYYPKYKTKNPIERFLVKNFLRVMDEAVLTIAPQHIHEVGCGEGYLLSRYASISKNLEGSDISSEIIEKAKTIWQAPNYNIEFDVKSIYDLNPKEDSADLILCAEVLEHLEEPQKALQVLNKLSGCFYLFSVPNEPLWRILNLFRMKYVVDFGNTPGHVNHWNRRNFTRILTDNGFRVLKIKTPLPWIVCLCEKTN